jgi:hypothetical protein
MSSATFAPLLNFETAETLVAPLAAAPPPAVATVSTMFGSICPKARPGWPLAMSSQSTIVLANSPGCSQAYFIPWPSISYSRCWPSGSITP